jgi:hypothetical protein
VEILDNPELIRRAYADWFRRGETVRPTHDSAHVRVYGLEYVALLGRIGILAVYRVRPTGALKRLKQWPAELDTLLGRIESVPGSRDALAEGMGSQISGSNSGKDVEPLRTAVRDHPELLGFRLLLMQLRANAQRAGSDEWVQKLDRAIDILKNS